MIKLRTRALRENMLDSLFASAPGFDQPLAVLKHCHDRIRKQLATLGKLQAYLAQPGAQADAQAQAAAQAVLNYFQKAAPLHHEDEEVDLFPTLANTARGKDLALFQELLPRILQQHTQMAELWQRLEQQLLRIAKGQTQSLQATELQTFEKLYQEHMQIEESQIAAMAMRLFSSAQMQKLGSAMQARRGIVPNSQFE